MSDSLANRALPPLGVSTTRSDLVVESIKAAILSGQLGPEEVLVERRIAEELGVSKTPVREALIVLARSGLLTVTRNRGVAVRRLTFADVRHVYEQRVLLEPWAVASVVRAGDADLSVAEAALKASLTHLDSGDVAASALANRRFHSGLYSSCENDFVVRSLENLQDLTALATTGVLWEKWPTWKVEAREHQSIFDAAKAGDADTASDLMRAHIQTSIERLHAVESAQPR